MFDEIDCYLKKVKKPEDDKCHICSRTHLELKKENPIRVTDGFTCIPLLLTYRLSRPICTACYYSIQNNEEYVCEIIESNKEDTWFGPED